MFVSFITAGQIVVTVQSLIKVIESLVALAIAIKGLIEVVSIIVTKIRFIIDNLTMNV